MSASGVGGPVVTYNALALEGSGAGVSTYIRELIAALPDPIAARAEVVHRRGQGAGIPAGMRRREVADVSGVRRALLGLTLSSRAELVHGLDVDLPLRSRAARVATVHDLSVLDAAAGTPVVRRAGERGLVRRSIRSADAVIAVSAFTAERIAHHFGITAEVVPEACPPDLGPAGAERIEDARARYGLPDAFVLHVGSLDPRKGLGVLADAAATAGLPLVLAGASLWASPPSGALVLGYVPRSDLPALYGAATVVAYVSTYEGFGLPPLEAMACGAPVVTTPVPSVTELIGEVACTVPAGRAAPLARALTEIAADGSRREALVAACTPVARARTWAQVAAETVAVYRRLGVTA